MRWIVTAALLVSLAGLVLSQIGAASHANPTVMLVHGAWADSGS
jgi:hypothetical protein